MRTARAASPIRAAGAAALWLVAAAGSPAQEAGLVPIDQGFTDLDPLAQSLVLLPPDLRVDSGFERLYADPSDPSRLYRIDNGLRASFPRSEYQATRFGAVPLIPAGVEFFIGPEAPWLEARAAGAGGAGESRSVSTRIEPLSLASPTTRVTPTAPGATGLAMRESAVTRADLGDEAYRSRRLRAVAARLSGAPD